MKSVMLIAAFSLSACATDPQYHTSPGNDPFIATNYGAADQLAKNLRANKQEGPMIVATFSNIDNLVESSRLGRTLSEQISSRLVQAGFRIIEIKLRDNVYMSNTKQGEFLLSRELRDISTTHKVNTVIVGTYADANNYAYVTLKAISLDSSSMIASYDYVLPMIPTVRALLPQKK